MSINIMLVDDHAMIREGLKQLLELDGEIKVISEAGDGESCLRQLEVYKPDVLLLDINMPKIDGLATAKKIKQIAPSTKIAIITGYNYFDYYVTTNFRVIIENGWLDDLKYLCNPTIAHKKRSSVEMILSEGIAREFNRHRTFSVSQQSTRYCNFSKDKFGNEISFIKPYWYNSGESVTKAFESYCKECESEYMCLIKDGLLPQEAREVLPLSTATKVMYTAFESDWKHFFELRCSPAAHPDARKLANEIKNVL